MSFANKIRKLREQRQLLQREVSVKLEIDNALYSKIECGKKKAKKEQVQKLAQIFDVNEEDLINIWLADEVFYIISDEDNPNKILNIVSESIVEYGKKQRNGK